MTHPWFEIAGERRTVSVSLWISLRGPKPPLGFKCDGCSMSPDVLRGYKLWPACVIHDFHYEPDSPLGGTWHARRTADRILRDNIRVAMKRQGASDWFAKAVAHLYYGRVRIWGAKAYFYAEGEEPRGFIGRVKEVYGAWIPRPDARSETARKILVGHGIGQTKP